MNTRTLLVSLVTLVILSLAACQAQAAPPPTQVVQPTTVPPTSAPTASPPTPTAATRAGNDFSLTGDSLPDQLLNVDFTLVGGNPPNVMRFYSPEDPVCRKMNTENSCFTILRPDSPSDPGARGPAAIVNGLIAAKFQLCPFCDESEIGGIEYFESKENGGVLVGVKCELNTGAACTADVGSKWIPTPKQTTWQSPENSEFRLPMSVTPGPGWTPVTGNAPHTLDILNSGNPPAPQSQWWGPSIFLVNGAKVADPEAKGVAKLIPWPDDFFGYVASFPTVKVIKGPEPVSIDGIQGSQMIIQTSPGPCYGLWLKDDSMWIAGGPKCRDEKQQMILLDVNGESVLFWFPGSLDKFDERFPLIQEIFKTIMFDK